MQRGKYPHPISEAVVQGFSVIKGVLRNFGKFTGKRSQGLRPATLLKNRFWHRCFLENFVKFLRTPFSIEHLRWLLPLFINLVPLTIMGNPTIFKIFITFTLLPPHTNSARTQNQLQRKLKLENGHY